MISQVLNTLPSTTHCLGFKTEGAITPSWPVAAELCAIMTHLATHDTHLITHDIHLVTPHHTPDASPNLTIHEYMNT